MREIGALVRASWHTAISYRVAFVLSVASMLVTVLPVYFVSKALQPLAGGAIVEQGGSYFGFLVVGFIGFAFISTAVNAVPTKLGGAITTGTLEALLSTRASLPTVLTGLVGYQFLLTLVKSLLFLVAALLLGMSVAWQQSASAVLLLTLIVLAYLPFGLLGAAMMLAFRTTGPLPSVVLILSGLLGGVYYPMSAHVIPDWVRQLSDFVPLTYGLRALRETLLRGQPLWAVRGDLFTLVGFVLMLWALGLMAMAEALRYARRAGTLAQY